MWKLLLIHTALLTATSDGSDGTPPDYKAVLLRVVRMDTVEQQQWLLLLEARLNRANRLVLDPEEAAKEQAGIHDLLRRKNISVAALLGLLQKLDAAEKTVADRLMPSAKPQAARWPQRGYHCELPSAPSQPPTETTGRNKPSEPRGLSPREVSPQDKPGCSPAVLSGCPRPAKSIARPSAELLLSASSEAVVSVVPTVRVNLDELSARIAGYNLMLRALEDELDGDGPWNAERLAPLVERLKILLIRRADLSVFLEIVPHNDRTRVGRLELPKSVVSRIGQRISDARTRAEGLDSPAERRAELQRLDELSRQLTAMVSAACGLAAVDVNILLSRKRLYSEAVGARTPDLRIKSPLLYQLSYSLAKA